MPKRSINSTTWSYTDGMHAVTEMSNGTVLPSDCGISAVTALPPICSLASNSRKSNRSVWWCKAHAAPSPDMPLPTIAILRCIVMLRWSACRGRAAMPFSALGGTRTPNLLIRNQMLYPIELQALVLAGTGPDCPMAHRQCRRRHLEGFKRFPLRPGGRHGRADQQRPAIQPPGRLRLARGQGRMQRRPRQTTPACCGEGHA